jgi:hypothetical protein
MTMNKAIEIVASVWLLLVAVQFLDRYFGTSSLDLTYTYWAMLAILAATSGVRAVNWFRERKRKAEYDYDYE